MKEIYNWYIKYNNEYGFKIKGAFIINNCAVLGKTNPIVSAEYVKEDNCIIAVTNDNRSYRLSASEFYMGRRCYPPQEWVDKLHREREEILQLFCSTYKFPEAAQVFIDARAEAIQKLEQRVETLKCMLPENTIYIDLRDYGYYFNFAVCNEDGDVSNCEMYYHSSWARDSVLITSKHGYPARFFPNEDSSVEFYKSMAELFAEDKTPIGTLLGYLHNSGHVPLRVQFSWGGKLTVQPDEEIEVRYGMNENNRFPTDNQDPDDDMPKPNYNTGNNMLQ